MFSILPPSAASHPWPQELLGLLLLEPQLLQLLDLAFPASLAQKIAAFALIVSWAKTVVARLREALVVLLFWVVIGRRNLPQRWLGDLPDHDFGLIG